VRFVH